jgi:hypothetical protein
MSEQMNLTAGKRLGAMLIAVLACVSFGAFATASEHRLAASPASLNMQSVMDKKLEKDLELMIFIHRAEAWTVSERPEGSVHENG